VRFRVGLGFDIHPFGDSTTSGPLVLGGVTIDGAARLAGHSDGDAVAHAVSDAILGPAGLPDLGTLYPATDEQWRDADSMAILRDVAVRVTRERWWVGNVDVVIAAETPKLAPHIEQMHVNLSAALEPAREPMGEPIVVSIKPKRGEGLGAIGRGEGIAVWAIVYLGR
jgi:2-C-methyl-D-erythritol 2,4-cyclodiphosphate synthase